MKTLYINNFRGFTETYIPIKNVNFFVGENSTGKSSILSILRLISSPFFWNKDDFNLDDVELGFFNELISRNTKGKKEFQIGFHIDDETKNERERAFNTVLVNYKNDKGAPKLSEIRLIVESFNIHINVGEKQLRFFIKEVPYRVECGESFKKWVNDSNFENIPYKILHLDDEFGRRLSFFEIRKFLRDVLTKNVKLNGNARPNFLPYSTWIAPIRTKPKRIYESFKLSFSPEGSHTPLLIKSILNNQFKKNITKEEFSKSIVKFGKQSGLFDKIEVENLGKDMSSPFVLNIYLNGIPLKLTNVGYGVGQVLPLLAEILIALKGRWFSIQQPEVHLHPKAQAALGEFMFEAASEGEKNFLIETHSDFIIDRFRYCLKKNKKKPTSQVLFFERTKNGNRVISIDIDELGQYSEEQPKAFRDFFINEELNLLTL